MTADYSYTKTFTLSKEYLSECYDQSVAVEITILTYKRAIISLVFGICLLVFKLVSDYLAFLVISFGILEVFSTRYAKTWWLWRQMLGKSYKSTVTMLINDAGINISSMHVNETIEWQSVSAIDKTQLGFIVRHPKGSHYLSNSFLDEATIDYMFSKTKVESKN
ncbi:YcxB family protein [Gammaproteobacteria bacterium AS21]